MPAAVPVPGREFSRTERLLIRFDVYGPAPTSRRHAVLMNRAGQKMSDLPDRAGGGRRDASDRLGLASFPAGEYLIEITAKSATGEAKELVAVRVRLT